MPEINPAAPSGAFQKSAKEHAGLVVAIAAHIAKMSASADHSFFLVFIARNLCCANRNERID
jgi:hypothetical protein